MLKKDQTLIERRARRLGELLKLEEENLLRCGERVMVELVAERIFLAHWLGRQLSLEGVFSNTWAWR